MLCSVPFRVQKLSSVLLSLVLGMLVLARPKRTNCGFLLGQTGRNVGIGPTKQTEKWVLARGNRQKIASGPSNVRPKFFLDRGVGLHWTPSP